MKIGFAWKWWAWKTTLSSLIINKISEKYKVLALDLDSNVNLAASLWMTNLNDLIAFWTKKEEVMSFTWSTCMVNWEDRIYLPKDTDWFYNYESDFINKYSISKWNIKTMSLGFIEDEKRWIESMCDYYEMSKVFVNHINLDNDEVLIADLAAWVEMVSRATIMSFDLIFVITDANFKNIKVANQILKWLELTWFTKDEIVIIPNKYLDNEDLTSIKNNFSDYNIINGIEFSNELYDLDSKKELTSQKIDSLDKAINSISDYIIDFRLNNLKSKEEIYQRIKILDSKKENFMK